MNIRHSLRVMAAILFACTMPIATAAFAVTSDQETSRPVETPHPPSMPAPLDIAYPGTTRLRNTPGCRQPKTRSIGLSATVRRPVQLQ